MRVSKTNKTVRVHLVTLSGDINRTKEFERKCLAQHAVNAGLRCGHDCTYCSTGTTVRTHPAFKKVGEHPTALGFAILDPDAPLRVAEAARRKRKRGLIQLSTTVDAWSPEAQKYNIGRRCLEAILKQPGWSVRILTKNAAVAEEYNLIAKYRTRVTIGLSLTATPSKGDRMAVVEPYASPNGDRLEALRLAHRRGLRTYAMLCPLLPGIADSDSDVRELVDAALEFGAEEIFAEPINPRGSGLILTADALRSNGFIAEADAVDAVRNHENWSAYTRQLLGTIQAALRARSAIQKLRFLLYPANLQPADLCVVRQDDEGVRWLGK